MTHILQTNFNESLVGRLLPMPTLGRGRAGLVKKSFNFLSIVRMESASLEAFSLRCSEVIGIVADQGTEKGMADFGKIRLPHEVAEDDGGGAAHAFVNVVWMPEHLHIFNNALESSITSLPVWKQFMHKLRSIERFCWTTP